MKIYTKTGDQGQTGLLGGKRVSKDDERIEAYGTVDELSSVLGIALTHLTSKTVVQRLMDIQRDLFVTGAQLATPIDRTPSMELDAGRIGELEKAIDEAEAQLPTLRNFILPGGCPAAAALHHARVVCRRAERRVVALSDSRTATVIQYLNRLSDLLFVSARLANAENDTPDVVWS